MKIVLRLFLFIFVLTSTVGCKSTLLITSLLTNSLKDATVDNGNTQENFIEYFFANDGTNGNELWVTDGTLTGTRMVKNISEGELGSYGHKELIKNGKLYFSAEQYNLFNGDPTLITGYELWVSDSTSEGTFLLKDIDPGAGSSHPFGLTALGDKVIFAATNDDHGTELWVTDGTPSGTVLVKDISPGESSSIDTGLSSPFIVYNNKAYFSANDGIHGDELWVTDGTTAGTYLVKNLNSAIESSSNPHMFNYANGKLLFFAYENGLNIYASDGTSEGTTILKTYPGTEEATVFEGKVSNNRYVFSMYTTTFSGTNLFSTDGTIDGTIQLTHLNGNWEDFNLYSTSNDFYFYMEGALGYEPYISDGTIAGTQLMADVNSGEFGIDDSTKFISFNGMIFFAAADVDNYKLWKSNGTALGTNRVMPLTDHNGIKLSSSNTY